MRQHEQQVPIDAVPDRVLRWPEVAPLVGVSRVTWWRMIRKGEAPRGIRVSPNCVGWKARDIVAFQARRTAEAEAA